MWRPDPLVPPMQEEEFRLLRDLVHAHCGILFRDDLRYVLERRLWPRLQALGLGGWRAYYRHLRFEPGRDEELAAATDLLTTNETYFHREPHQLRAFAQEILPELAARGAGARRLRILSAGCSTGEEPHTVAILVRDSGLFERWDVEVAACDISRRVLEVARAGAYGEHAFRNPEAEAMRRWFHLRGGRWVVDDAIRGMVRFFHANLLDPRALAPVEGLDVLFCRNVMIYFDIPTRRRVLRGFHAKLRPGGWLLLGHAESLLHVTADFELAHLRNDLVYRRPGAAPAEEAP
ncbi:MAG TPA: CheR family methyltransferase [Anaeromyxobacteraceae bacterium]|nr:CheR family methyltransferase [Anaeromyxobacteraceae bacterium]